RARKSLSRRDIELWGEEWPEAWPREEAARVSSIPTIGGRSGDPARHAPAADGRLGRGASLGGDRVLRRLEQLVARKQACVVISRHRECSSARTISRCSASRASAADGHLHRQRSRFCSSRVARECLAHLSDYFISG